MKIKTEKRTISKTPLAKFHPTNQEPKSLPAVHRNKLDGERKEKQHENKGGKTSIWVKSKN